MNYYLLRKNIKVCFFHVCIAFCCYMILKKIIHSSSEDMNLYFGVFGSFVTISMVLLSKVVIFEGAIQRNLNKIMKNIVEIFFLLASALIISYFNIGNIDLISLYQNISYSNRLFIFLFVFLMLFLYSLYHISDNLHFFELNFNRFIYSFLNSLIISVILIFSFCFLFMFFELKNENIIILLTSIYISKWFFVFIKSSIYFFKCFVFTNQYIKNEKKLEKTRILKEEISDFFKDFTISILNFIIFSSLLLLSYIYFNSIMNHSIVNYFIVNHFNINYIFIYLAIFFIVVFFIVNCIFFSIKEIVKALEKKIFLDFCFFILYIPTFLCFLRMPDINDSFLLISFSVWFLFSLIYFYFFFGKLSNFNKKDNLKMEYFYKKWITNIINNDFNIVNNFKNVEKYNIFDKNSFNTYILLLSFLIKSSSKVKTQNQLFYYYNISLLLIQENFKEDSQALFKNEDTVNIKTINDFYDEHNNNKFLLNIFDVKYFENINETKYNEFIYFISHIYRGDFDINEIYDLLNNLNIKINFKNLFYAEKESNNVNFKIFIKELIFYCGDDNIFFEFFNKKYFETIDESKYKDFIYFTSEIYEGEFNIQNLFNLLNNSNINLDSKYLHNIEKESKNIQFKEFINKLEYNCCNTYKMLEDYEL